MGHEEREELGRDHLVGAIPRTMDHLRKTCLAMRRKPHPVHRGAERSCDSRRLELAAACDLRLAADDDGLGIGVPEMIIFGALPTGAGGTQYLVRLMGPSRALEFILCGEPITPRRALAAGLVDRFAPDAHLEGARSFARAAVDKGGRFGLAAARSAVFCGDDLPIDKALEVDHKVHWNNMRRGKFLAGADAFVARLGG